MRRVLFALAALCALLGVACAAAVVRFLALLLCCAAVFFAGMALLRRRAESGERCARLCERVLWIAFGMLCTLFFTLEGLILFGAHSDEIPDDVTCVVILGGGIRNGEPQPMLRARLDAALPLLAQRPELPVIVSGSVDPREKIAEAEVMAHYLERHGVAAQRVWIEDRATSTRTNFTYSYALMAERGIDPESPFVFVTSDFHVFRSRYLASSPNAFAIAAKCPPGTSAAMHELGGYVREAFALVNDYLRIGADLNL